MSTPAPDEDSRGEGAAAVGMLFPSGPAASAAEAGSAGHSTEGGGADASGVGGAVDDEGHIPFTGIGGPGDGAPGAASNPAPIAGTEWPEPGAGKGGRIGAEATGCGHCGIWKTLLSLSGVAVGPIGNTGY